MSEVLCPEPGVYRITPEQYHQDPCPEPSLSCSIIKDLLHRSPLHAAVRHPKLANKLVKEEKDTFDLGTAAHTLILGDKKKFAIHEGTSWRGNIDGMKSGEWKAEQRAAGLIPILEKDYDRARDMVLECFLQLNAGPAKGTFNPEKGEPEVTLVWKEGDVWCRILLDWLPRVIVPVFRDYKSTMGSARPDVWLRTAINCGYHIQDAWYSRGITAILFPGVFPNRSREEVRLGFVVQEHAYPHALSLCKFGPATRAMADRQCMAAVKMWRDCMRAGEWPGYPIRECEIEAPAYAEADWTSREHSGEFDEDTVERLIQMAEPI